MVDFALPNVNGYSIEVSIATAHIKAGFAQVVHEDGKITGHVGMDAGGGGGIIGFDVKMFSRYQDADEFLGQADESLGKKVSGGAEFSFDITDKLFLGGDIQVNFDAEGKASVSGSVNGGIEAVVIGANAGIGWSTEGDVQIEGGGKLGPLNGSLDLDRGSDGSMNGGFEIGVGYVWDPFDNLPVSGGFFADAGAWSNPIYQTGAQRVVSRCSGIITILIDSHCKHHLFQANSN